VGRQLFSALLDRLGVDQDKGEDRRLRTLGDPGVHVPRCTQMSPAFIGTALEVDRLAEGLGAVYEFRPPARCELDHRRVILADDVSPNTRVECPKVPTELRLREPLIDSGGGFERFLLPRLRFVKGFGYLNF